MATKDALVPSFVPIPLCPKDDFDVFGASEEEKEKADQMENLSK